MEEIVYYSSQDLATQKVFTNSRLIAERFGKRHDRVLRSIDKQIADNIENGMEYFNHPNFGAVDYIDAKGESRKMYELTEDGFLSIALSFTGKEAQAIRIRLIEEFRKMERELLSRKITRQKGIEARKSLTDVVKMNYDGEHLGFKIKAYTDFIYGKILGMSAKSYKEKYNIGKDENLRNYLTEEELEKIDRLENSVGMLVDIGKDYKEIKEFLS
jgi:Rha family phage regulatory protein